MAIVTMLFVASCSNAVHAKTFDCPFWFSEYYSALADTRLGQGVRRAAARKGLMDSVQVTGTVTGRFGHLQHVVELRPGQTWGDISRYPVRYADIVLDPRVIVEALGADNAKKLGFELIGEKLIIPGPDELNAAIKAFNATLPSNDHHKILLSFYSTDDIVSTGRGYIEKFSRDLQLPLARRGHLLLHDSSAHAGSMFVPPEILAESRKRIGAAMGLIDWIRAHDRSLAKASKKGFARIESIFTGAIDAGTNDLQLSIFREMKVVDRGLSRGGGGRLVRPFDDVSLVTTEDQVRATAEVLGDKLSKTDKANLATHLEDFLRQLRANDPSVSELPYGLKRDEIIQGNPKGQGSAWLVHDSIVAKEASIIQSRAKALQEALANWNVAP